MVAKVVASEIVNKVTTEGVDKSIRNLKRLEMQLNKVKKVLDLTSKGFEMQSRYADKASKKVETTIRNTAKRVESASMSRGGRTLDKAGIIRDRAAESRRIVGAGNLNPELVRKYQRDMARLANQFRNTDMTARTYNRGMRQINHELRAASRNTMTLTQRFNNLRTSMVAATAAYSGGAAAMDVLGVGQMFQTASASMKVFSNDVEKDFKFVSDEAKRLGLDLQDSISGFTKLGVTSKGKITEEEMKELFTGYSEFATAVGADKFRTEKGLTAINQMLNKNQIMSEELKNQLAEQIPGAFQVFEKALGMTSEELIKAMENGELMADEVLPKVAKQFKIAARAGGALDEMLESSRVQQARLTFEFQQFKNLLFTKGFDEAMSNLFTSLSQILEVTKPLAAFLGGALASGITTLLAPVRFLTSLFLDLADILGFKFNGEIAEAMGRVFGFVAALGVMVKMGPIVAGGLAFITAGVVKLTVALAALAISNPVTALAGIAALSVLGGSYAAGVFDDNSKSAIKSNVKTPNVKVGVEVKDSELKNVIDARVISKQNEAYSVAAANVPE